MNTNYNPAQKIDGNFKIFCQKVLPLAFDESMSYYETLCALTDKVQQTINALNNNADSITEMQNLFTELQNYVNDYFTNLDVQQEINNKLDEMVNDGTLSSIIEPIFSNITNSITNLENNKRDKSVLINMGDLSQDVKNAMTGGSVAVVGNKSVNASTIQNHSIMTQNLSYVDYLTTNLADITTLKLNTLINNSGVEKTSNSYMCTDFIDIGNYTVGTTILTSNNRNGATIFYDENKTFLKYISNYNNVIIDIKNVKYVRQNILMSQTNIMNNYYLSKGITTNYQDVKMNVYDHTHDNYIRIPTANLFGSDISPLNCNFIQHNTNSIYNKYNVDKNGYWNNYGKYVSNIVNNTNTYAAILMNLPVYIPNETIFYQGNGTGFIVLFDINMNFLGSIENPNASNFTIPYKNASYIGKSLLQTQIDNYYLIPNTNNLIDEYILNPEIKINNIDTDNILYNKKIGFLGDSITYGLGATNPFPSVIQENNSCVSINYGISGNSIAKAGPNSQPNAQENPMCIRYVNMDNNLDYVVVFGGSNDYAYDIPLGDENSTNIKEFYGGLNTLITGLIQKYPGKPILFLTPLYRGTAQNNPKLLSYRDAIIKRCNYYSIPVFNLTDKSTIKSSFDNLNTLYYSSGDRLHPNNAGHKILARIIEHQLKII